VQVDGQQSGEAGGKLAKAMTEMYAPPPPAVGNPYELTLIDIGGAPPTGKTWNGSISNSWYQDPGNWTPAGTPTATDDVTIPAGTPFSPVIGGNLEFETNNLTIDMGASLTLDFGGYLTTNGDLVNNGTFTILSEESAPPFPQAGSYINKAGISGTGQFNVSRDIACTGTLPGSASPDGWHYISAPLDGFTTDDMPNYFINAWNQGTGNWEHYNMNPYTNPCETYPTTGLATTSAWSINEDLTYPDPNCPGLPAGVGTTIDFTSDAAGVHTGTYTRNLGYAADGYKMYDLVGNPYPSGLELSDIVWGTNTMQSVYLWLGCSGDYFEWTPAMGSQPIGVNQGFFVRTTGAGGSIEFNDAERVHGGLGLTKSAVSNLLTLRASGNDLSDLLNVRFMDDMTAGIDLNGDAYKLFSETEGLPQIYTLAGADKLAINALPATNMVPMGFTANGSGTYTIDAIETSDFANVVLEDMENGVQTDLLTSSYSFNYTTGVHNFRIHFTPLGTIDNLADNITISAENHNIYVNVPGSVRGDIAVYNMMGQEVVRVDMNPGLNTIPMQDVNTYYIVKVISDAAAKTGKVFIR
jgi:hypothetical protein